MDQEPSCKNCRLANWKRTEIGRLHPDGSGRCDWRMPVIPLPKAFYYISWRERDSVPPPNGGGHIDRRKPETDCPCWVEAE